ncbi:MAG: hypothetical protein FHK78_18760 [Sedimenticola selenatireducens]|uniref:Uncharacterized protein n=1 Tax=Sedimenticola selenatireducens TaxID=191960 RepID=A0A558DI13_9GAMM|nr:hypothetical protein [Sedimenticola selenatireducens]TVO67536.1 hypothetical protein FHP88_19000 [Sedimenticola selenatireducens]TVT60583.1 MAG: hypothetical protein FHK78_18760 [Sedimenticola selenatireducens]
MQSYIRQNVIIQLSLLLSLLISHTALAQDPQTEMSPRTSHSAPINPKFLNPQPEVPSKSGNAKFNPKALNPQPEVPSKPKKSERRQKTKSKPPKSK